MINKMVNVLRKRLHAGCYIVFSSCLFIILYSSCQKKRDDSLFLQKYEYKLWYIVKESEPQDSSAWIQLGSFKIEPSWEEDVSIWDWGEDYQPSIAYDLSYDRAWYCDHINTVENPRYFVKKGETPEFLYMDRDGYACVLYFDRNAANFFEKPEAEMTGYWELKNDSIMILNNNRYSFRKIGKNLDTVLICNLKTGDSMKIMDANFPLNLRYRSPVGWTDENEKYHKERWGFGIKQSPFLQGYDCKLWREEKCRGFYEPYDPLLKYGHDYISWCYYYCRFIYFDKYGGYDELYLSGLYDDLYHPVNRWCIWESDCNDVECDEMFLEKNIYNWFPNGNDSTHYAYRTVDISFNHKDTLHLRDVETGEEIRYIAVNLPPKSKWEKSKK